MTLLRSALLSTLLLAACGGSSKSPSTMPEPAAPAADEVATPVEAAPAEEPTPDAEPAASITPTAPATEASPKTRAPMKKPSRAADPCDGGE